MIRIETVGKTFGRARVLDGVSLSIDEAERVALIGSNGAGKTSLIRCLLGEYAFSGEIRVDGRSPRRERRKVLDGIGFVPQLPPPLKMPVGDLVRFAAAVSRAGAAQITAVLARLGLELADVAAKPFVKLSGGQKQKILSAIALGRECRLLILDEPTANLDPAARKVLFDLLAERPDRTMIISSHRIEEVAGLVNRVVEMDRGKIVLDERIDAASGLAARQRDAAEARPDHHQCKDRDPGHLDADLVGADQDRGHQGRALGHARERGALELQRLVHRLARACELLLHQAALRPQRVADLAQELELLALRVVGHGASAG